MEPNTTPTEPTSVSAAPVNETGSAPLTTNAPAPETTSVGNGTSTPMAVISRIPRTYMAFAAGLILALALGYFFYTQMAVPLAAVVNGTKITQAEVDKNIAMMQKSAELQGLDTTDPAVLGEIKKQALDNLVNNALLMGAATKAGMSANEAAVQSAYDALVAEVGGADELKSRMETVGLTSDTLMSNISDRLVADQYIESVTDIENATVTEEEIAGYLDSISSNGAELPPLEEIKPQITSTLLAQKQQGIVEELLAKLRSEATIEIK